MLRLIMRRLAVGLLVASRDDARVHADAALGDLANLIAARPQRRPTSNRAQAYGLDRPLYVQSSPGRARRGGDFGQSYFFKDSVANLIARRLPITLTLGWWA